MNGAFFEFPQLLMASITLALSATLAWLLLKWIKPTSHRMHRIVWFAVLLNGVLLVRYSVDVPVLSPDSPLTGQLLKINDSQISSENSSAQHIESVSKNRLIESLMPARQTDATGPNKPRGIHESRSTVATTSLPTVHGPKAPPRFGWDSILMGIWAIGFMTTILFLAVRYVWFVRRVATAKPANSEWAEQFRRVRVNAGIPRGIPLLTHDEIGPALVLSPQGYRIVVPDEFWSQLNDSQREGILNHELAHVNRGDIWKSMLVTALAAFHWFNPFGWLAVRKFNDAAEWACDQAVGNRDTQLRTDFARALLCLSTSDNRFLLGASGFGSSNLTSRIGRLFESRTRDSLLGRITLSVLVVFVLSLGWVNLRFVTAATPGPVAIPIRVQDDEELDKKIKKFREGISESSDELTNALVDTLKTPSGRIAILSRISQVEEQMRNEAAKKAIPEFFATQVNDQFEELATREIEEVREDIANLSVALATLRSKLVGTTEADKMLTRFLDNENAAKVLYFAELRKGMRPSVELLMRQRLGRIFANDGSGRLVVRESAKAKLIEQLRRLDEVEEQMKFMKRELKEWSEEIVDTDELHKRLKEGLANPTGPVFFLAQLLEGGGQITERSEQYFEFLENLLVDTPDGLVIPDDRVEYVKSAIERSDQFKLKGKTLQQPITEIAEMIDPESSEAAKLARRFLQSEIGVAYISLQINFDFSSAEAIVHKITNDVLDETEIGLAVREDKAEDVMQFSREMLRQNRRLRRHTRILDPHLEKLDNQSLRQRCDSIEGKMLLIEKVQAYVSRKGFDGWPMWLEQHFDDTSSGYMIRDEARQAIKDLINDAQQIDKEMAKDDF